LQVEQTPHHFPAPPTPSGTNEMDRDRRGRGYRFLWKREIASDSPGRSDPGRWWNWEDVDIICIIIKRAYNIIIILIITVYYGYRTKVMELMKDAKIQNANGER
jgi:hypothetical protein